jgi:hypothetical protein
MRHIAVRTTMILVVALVFLSIVASIAFSWPSAGWIAPIGCTLLALGLALGLARRLKRRAMRSGASWAELSASDEYSDLYLGRRPITHYPRADAITSQIGDPPEDPPPPA